MVKSSKVKTQNSIVSNYSQLISIESLFQAWREFKRGIRNKMDVQVFERNLEDNLFDLERKLETKTYKHGNYQDFYINDPKRRHIHKALVGDRIVHHLLYKYLYGLFDNTFIFDSYSCRLGKGTHKTVDRLEKFARIVSKNYKEKCWSLKLDIKKFFDSIDHQILLNLISDKVEDENIIWLIREVIQSFSTPNRGLTPKGMPLGNLTSQIFANIYLNELDQFVKHELKIKYYIRYADDFVILDGSIEKLIHYVNIMESFLEKKLKLKLHTKKIIIRKLAQGIDFCGYVVLPHYCLVRTKTRNRIFKRVLREGISNQSLQSYLGHFSHAQTYYLSRDLNNQAWLNQIR